MYCEEEEEELKEELRTVNWIFRFIGFLS